MKIYNPFKQHIVRFTTGKFAVRKLTLWWNYKGLDSRINSWWISEEYIYKYCVVDTLEEAKKLLNKESLNVEVIHG